MRQWWLRIHFWDLYLERDDRLRVSMIRLVRLLGRVIRDAPNRLARRTSGAYRREIDGLRFFAISFVLIGHLCERSQRFSTGALKVNDWFSNTFYYLFQRPGTGVELFFMISGFVIFSPLCGKTSEAIDAAFLHSYFRRRALRIEPPYLIIIAATFLFVSLTGYVPPETRQFYTEPKSLVTSFLASFVYSHGWLFGTLPRLLPPAWSLEIEIQFYIAAPIIFLMYLSVSHRPTRAWLAAGVLALGLVMESLIRPGTGIPHLNFTLLNYFAYFWAGIVFCDFEGSLRRILQRLPLALSAPIGWIGVAILLTTKGLTDSTLIWQATLSASLLAGCVLMFCGVLVPNSSFFRFCTSGWASLLGGACYSIYLVHLQLMQVFDSLLVKVLPPVIADTPLAYLAVSLITTLPLVILSGMVFYTYVERTFMLKDWPARLARLALRPSSAA
jgi:peptidoglycan/LPS O-acetylase OafA/YrhL